MANILEVDDFKAPYTGLTFPGRAEEEKVLYVTREAPVMLGVRMGTFSIVVSTLILVGAVLISTVGSLFGMATDLLIILLIATGFVLLFGGIWWIYEVYRRTVFIITTRRLTKFIHTTPWNRYQLSLGLDKVEDSGAYTLGYLQAIFKLGTFVARSSAGNIKNFKIVNIHYAEDLHNWMNKLMFTFNKEQDKLDAFRPFAAKRAGERY